MLILYYIKINKVLNQKLSFDQSTKSPKVGYPTWDCIAIRQIWNLIFDNILTKIPCWDFIFSDM